MGMNLSGYLALIYVNKNAEKGQSASEIREMYFNAIDELSQSNKDSDDVKKPHVRAEIVK